MHADQVPARLDHLIYGVPDLDRGIDEIEERLGVRALRGGRHEAFGTCNALLSLGGEHYLELIAADRNAVHPPTLRILGLDTLDAPALISWVARSDDLEREVERSRTHGVPFGDVLSGSRTKPDGTFIRWKCTDPAAVITPGILPFLISWGATPSPAHTAPAGCVLRQLRAEHPRPDEARMNLERLGLDLSVSAGPRPLLIARLETPVGEVELR